MAFTPITVTRQYETAGGLPASGKVRFTLTAPMTNGATVIQSPVVVTLDQAGAISASLVANDDPATLPVDTSYLVREEIVGQPVREYHVQVPRSAPGGTVALSSLASTIVAPVVLYPLPGPQGPPGTTSLAGLTDVTTAGAAVDSLLAPTAFSGDVVTAWGLISGSAMLRPTFRVRAPSLSYLTTFQAGHTWTAAAGQAGTVALNDTTGTVMRGTQSVLITSSGGGNVGGQRAGLQSPTLPAFDMTSKGVRVQFVVEDPTNLLRVTAQIGQDTANGYSVDIGFPAGNTNNVFVPGEIYTVVVDLASANTIGTPATRSAMTSIKLTVTDNGGGAGSAKVRFLSVALQDRPTVTFPNGVITFGFDDGFIDQFTNARAILDRYGYGATCYVIQDLVGANPGATYMGLGQLHQLEDVHGWEIAAHSATIAEHNVTNAFASLTDSQLRANLEKHKRWLLREGFRGADHFAYPQGKYSAATVEIVEEYFATARTIIQGSLLEEAGGPADIQRMRCVPINAGTSLATLTALVDAAKRERLWLQFYTHRVLDTGATGTQIDTATFSGLVNYVAAADVAVATVSSALAPPRA